MFEFQPWQWAILVFGAFLIGVAKTGIAGLGVLTVALYANILPPKQSTGMILPMLVCADIVAVVTYRRHASWNHLWRLFPWVVPGVLAGYFAMGRVDDNQVRHGIGAILVVMVALHLWRQRSNAEGTLPHTMWFAAVTGLLAGFTTMVANAAGPIMTLYLLAVGLPKLEFLGTGAWYFLIINVGKLPLSQHLGLITPDTLLFNLKLVPVVAAGAWLGRWVVPRISLLWFERLALAMTLVAALRLLF